MGGASVERVPSPTASHRNEKQSPRRRALGAPLGYRDGLSQPTRGAVEAKEDTAALVGRAREGKPDAFEQLVRLHFRSAYAVALAVLGSAADAEDVAQEAFAAAFKELARCRDPSRFGAWLLQIVRNRALNLAGSRRAASALAVRLAPAPEASQTAPPAGEGAWLRERLEAALSQVSPAQREVVLLHDLDGWTHAEISAALGISEGMSRQHLFQARKAMRVFLASTRGEEEGGIR